MSAQGADRPRRAAREGAAGRRRRARADQANPNGGRIGADHRVAARRRPRAGRDDARPARDAPGRRRRRRRRRVGQGPRAPQLQGREAQGGAAGRPGRDPRLRQAAARRRARAGGRERPPGARARAEARASACAASSSRRRRSSSVSLENLFEQLQAGEVKDLNLVVKGDVQGSVEAIVSELAKIQHSEVRRERDPPGRRRDHRERRQCSPRRPAAWSSASTSARTPRRARSPSARASRSARTTSSTSSPRTSSRRSSACSRRSPPRRRSARPRCARPSAPPASARSPAAWSRAASSAAARTSASSATAPSSTTTTIDSLKRFQDDVREVQEGFECGIHLANFDDVKDRRRARGLRDARGRAHRPQRVARSGTRRAVAHPGVRSDALSRVSIAMERGEAIVGGRSSGVLLHVTSLPGRPARRGGVRVRRLARGGRARRGGRCCRSNPPDPFGSPYTSSSAFATLGRAARPSPTPG